MTPELHEAGHLVIAAVLGRAPLGATVDAGTRLAGCSLFSAPDPIPAAAVVDFDPEAPFIIWPGPVQRRLEADVMISLAGEIAELLLTGPAEGRVPDPGAELAAEDLAGFQLAGVEDQTWAAAVVDEPPMPSDRQAVTQAAFAAFGRDPVQSAAWTTWLASQTRALVIAHEATIRRLAAALDAHKVLGAEALTAVIRGGLVLV